MTAPKRVYWDSCCWIALINQEPSRFESLEYIYNSSKDGLYQIWTSTLSLVEVNRLASEQATPKPLNSDSLDILDEMFNQDFVVLNQVDLLVATEARRLLRDLSGLSKRTDSIHLATALLRSVDEMHTYDDKDLLHLHGKLESKDGRKLVICAPTLPAGYAKPGVQLDLLEATTEPKPMEAASTSIVGANTEDNLTQGSNGKSGPSQNNIQPQEGILTTEAEDPAHPPTGNSLPAPSHSVSGDAPLSHTRPKASSKTKPIQEESDQSSKDTKA